MGFLLLQESVNADFILQKNCFIAAGVTRHLAGQKKTRQWPFCEIFRSNKFNPILNKKVKSEKKRNFLTNVAFKVDSITEASVDVVVNNDTDAHVNNDTDADADVDTDDDPDVVTDTEAASRVESNMTSITFFVKLNLIRIFFIAWKI